MLTTMGSSGICSSKHCFAATDAIVPHNYQGHEVVLLTPAASLHKTLAACTEQQLQTPSSSSGEAASINQCAGKLLLGQNCCGISVHSCVRQDARTSNRW
jgi:hypothetical protein